MGLDTKTYWLTDRQSQCDFHFDFDLTGQFSWKSECEEETKRLVWNGRQPGPPDQLTFDRRSVRYLSTEAEEEPLITSVTKQRLVKTVTDREYIACHIVIYEV
jgi:hypothetical protein